MALKMQSMISHMGEKMLGKTDGTSRWEMVRQLKAGVLLVVAGVHVSHDLAIEANTRRNSNE